ncbi:hypothetical protein F3Y22_tig00110890pilonHSYRG01391 [Hibiscus syriacus]|uniref:D6-type cyclin n=1 Tax=Hibiscus syriacus TaxID=106335 RepID=A0A6A2ZIN5_HIBSY|nr:hypothetical protein F3Y22_tig00110890pilonHSYRG01391 [Hibiscus syriacus]
MVSDCFFPFQFACKFDPFIAYLAVNYLDRFLSSQAIPQQHKTWVSRLVAISCVSLAAKVNGPSSLSPTFRENGICDLGSIKMANAFDYSFLFRILFHFVFQPQRSFVDAQALNARAVELIFKDQSYIKILEFKPSIIAASALLFASNELFPSQFPCYHKAISSCSYVHKENLLECYNWMEAVGKESCSFNTTVNVLDQQFSCSESEEGRGKISDYSDNQTAHVSQVQHC